MGAFPLLRCSAQSEGSGAGLPTLHPAAHRDEPVDLGPVGEPLGAGALPCKRAVIPGTSIMGRWGGCASVYPRRSGERQAPSRVRFFPWSRPNRPPTWALCAAAMPRTHTAPRPRPHTRHHSLQQRARHKFALNALPSPPLGLLSLCLLPSGRMKNAWLLLSVHVPGTTTVKRARQTSGFPRL